MRVKSLGIPSDFIWKRAQSLAGLWLVIYMVQHIFVNSQAALFIGSDGIGFIQSVNSIHELPFLTFIEIAVLGVPFLIHGLLGVKYALTAKMNSFGDEGNTPYLPEYGRNRAFTWQRITSWLLIVGIIAHVVHMRFMEYPAEAQKGFEHYYMVKVDPDPGLYTLSQRLNIKLYDQSAINGLKNSLSTANVPVNASKEELIEAQSKRQDANFIKALERKPLKNGQMIAVAKDFGTAELMMLRETFKMPIMLLLYTAFLLAACFHGFNGLWTFMIKWGVTLTQTAQKFMLNIAVFLMLLIAFLGLAAIYGTYWINLRY